MQQITPNMVQQLEENIRDAIKNEALSTVVPLLDTIHPADIADILERLAPDEQVQLFRLLEVSRMTQVMHHFGSHTAGRLLDELELAEIGALLDAMPMDDVARLLTSENEARRLTILNAMHPVDAAEVRMLLQYPPGSAGRMATEQFAAVPPGFTVRETLEHLRQNGKQAETLTNIFILDAQHRLLGVTALSQIVTASPDLPLNSLMTTKIVSVRPDADQEEVARLVARYDFLSIPVIAEDGRMIGIITVDDLIHVLVEESTEDVLRMGAVEPGAVNQPYFTVPLWQVIRTRIGWLVLLFIGQSLTGTVLRSFESDLERMVALTFYIPMLIGMGGNTGAQTVSTIIRGLALREIQVRDITRVFRRELVSGMLLGLLLGVVAYFRVLLLGTSDLALVVAVSIFVICLWANSISSMIPLLAQKLRVDPALISAPLITTLVDATGLALYLMVARLLLGF